MTAAKEQWSPYFTDFDFVINNIKKHNKKWFYFSRVLSESKNDIYKVILKRSQVILRKLERKNESANEQRDDGWNN